MWENVYSVLESCSISRILLHDVSGKKQEQLSGQSPKPPSKDAQDSATKFRTIVSLINSVVNGTVHLEMSVLYLTVLP